MKSLYINNKRVVLDSDTYFPFTRKVSVLDDFNIIGLPSSKSVLIKRCQQNDEIFGYIAEITRYAIDNTDNLIGVSFSQISKTSYTLLDDSEVISEGIIVITNITEEGYEVELYDKIIDLIETFGSDAGYMSNLDLVLESGPYSEVSRANTVKNINDENGELKVLVNISTDLTYEEVIVTEGGVLKPITLSNPLKPIQFRTLKNYDFEYAVPLTTVVRCINDSFPNSVEIDSNVTDLFDEVHLLLGSPKQARISSTSTANGATLSTSTGSATTSLTNPINTFDFKSGANWLGRNNGVYDLYIPFELTFTPASNTVLVGSKKDDTGTFFYAGAPDGTLYGDLLVGITLSGYNGGSEVFKSRQSNLSIRCIQSVNTIVNTSGIYITNVVVSGVFPVSIEYYPQINPTSLDIKINFNFNTLFDSPSAFMVFKAGSSTVNFTLGKVVSPFTVNYKTVDIARTGTPITSSSLFSNITIKEFLMKTVKYFGLGVKNNDGVLNIHRKDYKVSPYTFLLEDIQSMEINTFDFNKLLIRNEQPSSDIITDYYNSTRKYYGEQVVNTGYKIRENTKEINFEIGIPVLLKDYNAYAYDRFANYYNAGYKRTTNGLTTNLSNNIAFCYIQRNDEPLWVSDDSYLEAGMTNNATEIKFSLHNEKIIYSGSEFIYPTTDTGSGSRLLEHHYTASPYIFNTNNVITKSLDINKPAYNFAGIPDVNYPISTTVYYNYFRTLIQDMYDINSHILNVSMYIDNELDIYNIYNYKNVNYIISEIVEYDPTEPGVYDVKLLKVKDINNYITPIYLIDYRIVHTLTIDGDVTALEPDFLGISSDVELSEGDIDGYLVKHSNTASISDISLVSGDTVITNEVLYTDRVIGDLTRIYRVANNKFSHSLTIEGETINLGTSISIEISEDGSALIMNETLTNKIIIEENSDRIVQVNVLNAYIDSVSALEPEPGVFDWLVTVKVSAKVINGEEFTSNTKFNFKELFFTMVDYTNPSNVDSFNVLFSENTSVTYADGLDGIRTATLTFLLEGLMYDAGSVAQSFSTSRIKSIAETGEYAFRFSYAGDYTDSILAVDVQQIPLTATPSSAYIYDELAGEYNDRNVYANLLNYKINFDYTKTKQ